MSPNASLTASSPLVSVVLPTHNRGDRLRDSIESVLAQSYPHFELLVVDDASTDHTGPVIAEYEDERVRWIRLRNNRGPAGARNEGIRRAKGEYLAFLDDDDQYRPGKLETLVRCLDAAPPEVGFAYSKVQYIVNGAERAEYPASGPSGAVFSEILEGLWFHPNSTLIKREAMVQFDEDLPAWEDLDFHLRIASATNAVFVGETTATYRMDDDRFGVSRGRGVFEQALKKLERRYFSARDGMPSFPAAHAGFLTKVGGNVLKWDMRRARAYFIRAFRTHPSPTPLVYLALSFLGVRPFYHLHALLLRMKWRLSEMRAAAGL